MTRIIPRLLLTMLLLSTEFASAQRAPIPQQLTFTPYHSTGIYKIGETVGWSVTPGPATPTYAYKYTVRRNNNVVLKEGKLDLSSGKDTIEITGDPPEPPRPPQQRRPSRPPPPMPLRLQSPPPTPA